MLYTGIDYHKRYSVVCTVDAEGRRVHSARIDQNEPAAGFWAPVLGRDPRPTPQRGGTVIGDATASLSHFKSETILRLHWDFWQSANIETNAWTRLAAAAIKAIASAIFAMKEDSFWIFWVCFMKRRCRMVSDI